MVGKCKFVLYILHLKFYAPWCGHCRRLEPTFLEAAQELKLISHSVKVAKVDVTHNNAVGSHFGINGFPTILYIHGSIIQPYEGKRTTRDIVQFTMRSSGSAVKKLTSSHDFMTQTSYLSPDPVFILVRSDKTQNSSLTTNFYQLANEKRYFSWFFECLPRDLPQMDRQLPVTDDQDQLLVFRHPDIFAYNEPKDLSTDAQLRHLTHWIDVERFATFPELVDDDYQAYQVDVSDKETSRMLLALFLLDLAPDGRIDQDKFGQLGLSIALNRSKVTRNFHFAWTRSTRQVGDLALIDLTVPNLVVVDPRTRFVYLQSNQGNEPITFESINTFLTAVLSGSVKGHGGDSYWVRVRRSIRIHQEGIMLFASNHPLVTLLMVGVPVFLLTAVCYLCFCLDDPYQYQDYYSGPITDECRSTAAAGDSCGRFGWRINYVVGPVQTKEEIEAKKLL